MMAYRKFLFLFLVFIVGCSTFKSVSIGDGGFLSNQPCGAPCFYNLTPGISTEKEFLSKKTESIFKSCRHYDYSASSGTQGYWCSFGNIVINEGKIIGITFLPTSRLTLQEAITKFGNPQWTKTIQLSLLPEEPKKLGLRLYYDQPCISLLLQGINDDKYVVADDSLIGEIQYSDSKICSFQQSDLTGKWKGYGTYP